MSREDKAIAAEIERAKQIKAYQDELAHQAIIRKVLAKKRSLLSPTIPSQSSSPPAVSSEKLGHAHPH